jgi:hypothetical protein
MMWKLPVAFLFAGCAGNLGTANSPPQLAPSTTLVHCVVLDAESDWLPPVGTGLAATGTGLGALAAGQDKPSLTLKVTEVSLMGAGLIATGVGMLASKSWHDQCVPKTTVVFQTAPQVTK